MKKCFIYFSTFTALRLYLMFSLLLFGVLILMIRNPDPFIHPAIYAEDGVWTGGGLVQGWSYLFLHARPDYLVVGNIILLWIATQSCLVFFGNPLLHLPQAISIIGYLFYSVMAVSAFYVSKAIIPFIFRVVLFVLLLLVPLGFSENEVIGRISNIGYFIPLIAIMLFYARSQCSDVSSKGIIDFFLFFCAVTNPLVIAFAAIYLLWDFWRHPKIKEIFFCNAILSVSFLVLAIYLLPRMIAPHPTHLQEFDIKELVEVVGARCILFPIIFPWYSQCFNLLTLLLSALWLATISYCYLKSENVLGKRLMDFLSVGLAVTIVATLIMRPGLTVLLHQYQRLILDRYFAGINLIVIFLTVLALGQLALSYNKKIAIIGWIAIGAMVSVYATHSYLIFELRHSRFPIMSKYTFEDQIKAACIPPNAVSVEVPICPEVPSWHMQVPAKWINNIQSEKLP